MYQGMLEVAYRTGIFKGISANIVYEGDLFEYDLGGDCYVKHQLDLVGKREKPIAVYSDMKLANGGRIVRVMTMAEIKKIQSAAKTQKVWGPWFDPMAIKTVIKQGFKFCPKNEDLSSLVAHDNALEQDFDRLPDNTKTNALNALLGNGAASEQLPEPEMSDADLDAQIEEENRKELETKD
jgi:recombination protein RecT